MRDLLTETRLLLDQGPAAVGWDAGVIGCRQFRNSFPQKAGTGLQGSGKGLVRPCLWPPPSVTKRLAQGWGQTSNHCPSPLTQQHRVHPCESHHPLPPHRQTQGGLCKNTAQVTCFCSCLHMWNRFSKNPKRELSPYVPTAGSVLSAAC